MATKVFQRKWDRLRVGRLAALLVAGLVIVLAAAALLALGRLRQPASQAGSPVEIVYDQPLRATHANLAGQTVTLAGSSAADANGNLSAAATLSADFFNFGSIAADAVVQHDFLVINRGNAPLEIRRAYTTCGCTAANLSTIRIPPGKAALATVIFDAGYHPAAGQTVRRGLILETNDPDHPQLEIWVQAAVR